MHKWLINYWNNLKKKTIFFLHRVNSSSSCSKFFWKITIIKQELMNHINTAWRNRADKIAYSTNGVSLMLLQMIFLQETKSLYCRFSHLILRCFCNCKNWIVCNNNFCISLIREVFGPSVRGTSRDDWNAAFLRLINFLSVNNWQLNELINESAG